MRTSAAILAAYLIGSAAGCGKAPPATDMERIHSAATELTRSADGAALEGMLSADSRELLAKLAPAERDEYLRNAAATLGKRTGAKVEVREAEGGSFLVRLRQEDQPTICLRFAPTTKGGFDLDLSQSIRAWAALVEWSRGAAQSMNERAPANEPRLTIGGIEMIDRVEPQVLRASVNDAFLSDCDEGPPVHENGAGS